jgi:hypothetical protein
MLRASVVEGALPLLRPPRASPLSSARPCLLLAILPSEVKESRRSGGLVARKEAGRRPRRRRCRRPHLGNADAQRGAAIRRPWWPSRPRLLPPPPPPLPQPGRLWLSVERVSQTNRGLAVRGGAGGKPRQQRRPLLHRPAAADGHRAAKTRRPLLPSGPLPPTLRGPARRPHLQMVHHGSRQRNRHSSCQPTSRPRGGPPT